MNYLYSSRKTTGSHKANGVTLIEVLVALFVLSVGLAGIASLHLFGLKAVHSSLQSSTAAVIALDLEEWLWEALGNEELQDRQACDAVIDGFRAHWFGGENVGRWFPDGSGDRLVGSCDNPEPGLHGECWISAQFTIDWPESRFSGGGGESFRYRIQLPCNP